MTEEELPQWFDANPTCINDWDRDEDGLTPLYAAIFHLKNLPLVLWLLDKEGADLNTNIFNGEAPLLAASSLDILNALLDVARIPLYWTMIVSPLS